MKVYEGQGAALPNREIDFLDLAAFVNSGGNGGGSGVLRFASSGRGHESVPSGLAGPVRAGGR